VTGVVIVLYVLAAACLRAMALEDEPWE